MFQKIIAVNYTFPTDMPSDTKDLISKMLKFNPMERIGAGREEDKLDFESLKSHSFFNGINFNSLAFSESPLL